MSFVRLTRAVSIIGCDTKLYKAIKHTAELSISSNYPFSGSVQEYSRLSSISTFQYAQCAVALLR